MTAKFYPLAHDNWNDGEVAAIAEVVSSGRYTMGPKVAEFEQKIAAFHGRKHAIMVNSGSSANLLMIAALVESGQLKAGDEVIVPAVSWSTTYFPLHQYGLKMVFVDVEPFGNIDINAIEDAITENTKAVFAVHLLGFAANIRALQLLCIRNDLIFLEDNCESFGACSIGTMTGTMGLMSSLSFFFSHHISTMEGGMILTDDSTLNEYLRSLRAHGWVRDVTTSDLYQKTDIPFEDSFKFVLPGYCVRPLEFSGAVGIVQLEKWKEQRLGRLENAKVFVEEFKDFEQCEVPEYDSESTWFGLPMIVKDGRTRRRWIEICEVEGIECRPIVAGNFVNQPVTRMLNHRVQGTLPNAERIDKLGLFFGNNGSDLREKIKWLKIVLERKYD
jgi:CDP-4-dehydro-6-deoxyglucose reductase, E1